MTEASLSMSFQSVEKRTARLLSSAEPLTEEDDRASLAETESSIPETDPVCDACPDCNDVCGQDVCRPCLTKPYTPLGKNQSPCCAGNEAGLFTMCQVKRHNTAESAWIVAGTDVYDVTSYLNKHPGGSASLLRRAGGAKDCTADLKFHSKKGQKAWEEFRIGRLVECNATADEQMGSKPWWLQWIR